MPSDHVFGAFSPDNELFVTIGDNGSHIDVFETYNLTQMIKIFCSGTFIKNMRFAVNSELLFVITTDCKIRIYGIQNDFDNFQANAYFIHELNCLHRDSLNSMSISPDNKYLFTAGSDNLVKIWDLSAKLTINSSPQIFIGHINPISSMILSAKTNRLVTCGGFEGIYVWDIAIEFDENPIKFDIDYSLLTPCARRRPEIPAKSQIQSLDPEGRNLEDSKLEEECLEDSQTIAKNLENDDFDEKSKGVISSLKNEEFKNSRSSSIKKMTEFRREIIEGKQNTANFKVEKLAEDFIPLVREFKKLKSRKYKDQIYSYKKNENRAKFNLPFKHYFLEKEANFEVSLKEKLEKIRE